MTLDDVLLQTLLPYMELRLVYIQSVTVFMQSELRGMNEYIKMLTDGKHPLHGSFRTITGPKCG